VWILESTPEDLDGLEDRDSRPEECRELLIEEEKIAWLYSNWRSLVAVEPTSRTRVDCEDPKTFTLEAVAKLAFRARFHGSRDDLAARCSEPANVFRHNELTQAAQS